MRHDCMKRDIKKAEEEEAEIIFYLIFIYLFNSIYRRTCIETPNGRNVIGGLQGATFKVKK